MKTNQSGNVLFLILIAVALFAALSYAVTQSRSGGGDAQREIALVDSAVIMNAAANVQLAVQRMLARGVEFHELSFEDVEGQCFDGGANPIETCVFAPEGGGISMPRINGILIQYGGGDGTTEVEGIGTTTHTLSSSETMMFFLGISESICGRINERLGIESIPIFRSPAYSSDLQGSDPLVIGTSLQAAISGTQNLVGQPQGCYFEQDDGVYVYYHVLIER